MAGNTRRLDVAASHFAPLPPMQPAERIHSTLACAQTLPRPRQAKRAGKITVFSSHDLCKLFLVQKGKLWQLALIIVLMVLVITDALPYYFDGKDKVYDLMNQRISMRSIILTKAFDILIWFGYQFYQIWRNPTMIKVVGKIHVKWQE